MNYIICGDQLASCICIKEKGHSDGVHKCNCAGSWDSDYNPLSWPGTPGDFEPFALELEES